MNGWMDGRGEELDEDEHAVEEEELDEEEDQAVAMMKQWSLLSSPLPLRLLSVCLEVVSVSRSCIPPPLLPSILSRDQQAVE